MREKFDEIASSIPYAKRKELEKKIENYYNIHKGCKPLTMLLFERRPKQKPKEYIKPNWELKDNILKNGSYLLQLHKQLHYTEYLLNNYLTSSSFDILLDNYNEPCGVKFDFIEQESKIYKGEYWFNLFNQLRDDFESHYCQEFSRENVDYQFYLGYKNTYDFVKEFSSLHEDIKSWFDIFNESEKTLQNTSEIDYFKECERLNNSLLKKRKRIKDKVYKLLEQPCLFLTFTFNEKTLQNTTEEQRRRKIRGLLTEFNAHYLGNIDYGKKNEREHYHIVLQCEKIDLKLLAKRYKKFGTVYAEKIKKQEDYERLGNYINKLTNHALKKTKLKTRLLYDRI